MKILILDFNLFLAAGVIKSQRWLFHVGFPWMRPEASYSKAQASFPASPDLVLRSARVQFG